MFSAVCINITQKQGVLISSLLIHLTQDVQSAFDASKQLLKKGGGAKRTFAIPTTGQVNQIIDGSVAIISALQKIVTFANDKKAKYPDLGTLAIEQSDIEKLNDDIKNIKKLPYA